MIGLGSMYAIAEMNARAEQLVMRVRSELFRIGCSPANFAVVRSGPHVRMQYGNQQVEADPHEVLVALRGTPTGAEKDFVWQQMIRHGHERAEATTNIPFGRLVAAAGLVLALVLIFYALVRTP